VTRRQTGSAVIPQTSAGINAENAQFAVLRFDTATRQVLRCRAVAGPCARAPLGPHTASRRAAVKSVDICPAA